DVIGYVNPWAVFGKEVNDAKRLFDKSRTREFIAYFVSSAGMGTRMGGDGQRKALKRVEQFINQVIWETRGLTKVTLLSDHGHSYTPATRLDLVRHLRQKGWRLTGSLRRPEDVVEISFGLVTYASFSTLRPAVLAADLIACEGVELASYAEDDFVVALGRGGSRAVIRHKDGRFKYEPTSGDPLKLVPVLAATTARKDGYYDVEKLLAVTGQHEYPAPLQRLWRAHFALVTNPPDVIVSLEGRFFFGSVSLAGSVNVASTHGGLNYSNSVTFITSTVAPLPPLMQSKDIPGHMSELLGTDWPMRK
ncbi:MAG: hypothetical protein KAU28_02795, partial [Phycisphaerae bacterium]|nr:hypothetical protein [Phycisphaerae bacterium]